MAVYLPKCVAKLADNAADGAHRYAMNGVRVIHRPDAAFRLEATDGAQLVRVEGVSGAEQYPALDSAPNGAMEYTVPAVDWREAFKAAKKHDKVGVVGSVDGVVTLGTLSMTRTGRAEEGRWPATDEVFPKGDPAVTVDFNPERLLQVLQTAKAIGLERCTLALHQSGPNGDYQLARFIGKNEDGLSFDSLVMPLSK
jgi:hypothetical protein